MPEPAEPGVQLDKLAPTSGCPARTDPRLKPGALKCSQSTQVGPVLIDVVRRPRRKRDTLVGHQRDVECFGNLGRDCRLDGEYLGQCPLS